MTALTPIAQMPAEVCRGISTLFCDIDDTLTLEGRVPAAAYSALWAAHQAGIAVVPVTGRPAGWCDHLARMWPVAAVVGENGALAYAMADGQMRRIYAPRRPGDAEGLRRVERRVLAEVPGCRIAADQPFRIYDLAVDFAEEVERLDEAAIDRIVAIFAEEGAQAKVSSIHVNGWYGDHDKLSMCLRCCEELLGGPLDLRRALYAGDSPNDEPMFAHFRHSVGVANVRQFVPRMTHLPAYITPAEGGAGFAELVAHLLQNR